MHLERQVQLFIQTVSYNMPIGSGIPVNQMTRRQLIASMWAFGIIGTVIGAGANADLFQTDPETHWTDYWMLWRLLALAPFLIATAAIRSHIRELRRRRHAENRDPSRPSA